MEGLMRIKEIEDCTEAIKYVRTIDDFINSMKIVHRSKKGRELIDARKFDGFVWNEYSDHWIGYVLDEAEDNKHALVSLFNGEPLVIRGYPKAHTVNDLKFDGKIHYAPKYDGVLVSTFRLPNGLYWGKSQEIEYIDRNGGMNVNFQRILVDLGVWNKLQRISDEFNATVHGIIVGKELTALGKLDEYEFIALDISDRKNHAFYTKELSSAIFAQYGLLQEEIIKESEIDDVIEQYGGVIAKSYKMGELTLFCKEEVMSNDIRFNRAVRNMYSQNCDFCWTNPSMDKAIGKYIDKYDLLGVTVEHIRKETHKIEKTPDLIKKIKKWLDGQYKKIAYSDPDTIYNHFKWKWEWSGTDDKDMIVGIIGEWQEEMRYRSAEEIFQLENQAPHSDYIYRR